MVLCNTQILYVLVTRRYRRNCGLGERGRKGEGRVLHFAAENKLRRFHNSEKHIAPVLFLFEFVQETELFDEIHSKENQMVTLQNSSWSHKGSCHINRQ